MKTDELKTSVINANGTKDLKQCPRCLFTEDIATIGETQCSYCDLQDQLKANSNPDKWFDVLAEIKIKGQGRKYDALIGISGGEDSSVLLYLAVKVWRLRILAIHFDNRSNRPEANHNIDLITTSLGVPFIRYYVNQGEYNLLNDAFLAAGVPDADIPNDIAMAKLIDTTCKQYDIKYILAGHDYRREGSSPIAWSYMDAKYVQSVYKAYTGRDLVDYPLYTFSDQIISAIKGIKNIRPYHYSDFDRYEILTILKEMGWKDYGGKHNENIYTAFVGNYLLPIKFKIDKRRTYLSAQIREGLITKDMAIEKLKEPVNFDANDLGERKKHILHLVDYSRKRPRTDFERYNFKRWKFVIWVLAKLDIVPFSFYSKYCK